MHLSCPVDSAGLSRLEASSVPPRGRTGPDQRMDLVDEQHGLGIGLELLEHRLEALLEIATVLGTGQQSAHVQRIDVGLFQDLRDLVLDDAPGQALGDGGLADAGLADQQRVVLAPTAQHLDHAFDLEFAPDQRIDLALARQGVEILRVLLQRRGLLARVGRFLLGVALRAGLLVGRRRLGDAVRDEIDHVQARRTLLMQVVHGVRVLLAEDRHQHVGAGDFLLAVGGRLHVHDRALDDALKAQRRLRVGLRILRQDRRVVGDEVLQALAQVLDIAGTSAQHLRGRRIVQQREQQVLDGDELVARLSGLDKRHVQTDFQFLRDHASSITHCSGCWCSREKLQTCSTLLAATSHG
jgi:hypothetical protein